MLRRLIASAVLVLAFYSVASADGDLYIYDRDASSRQELRQAAQVLGLTLPQLVALQPEKYVDLGEDPVNQSKIDALLVIQPGGIIYWHQTDITDQCTNIRTFALIAVQACNLRSSDVQMIQRARNLNGFTAECIDRTQIEIRNCTESP